MKRRVQSIFLTQQNSQNSYVEVKPIFQFSKSFRERRREETRQEKEKSGKRMGTKLSRVSNGKFVNSAGQLVPFVKRRQRERERGGVEKSLWAAKLNRHRSIVAKSSNEIVRLILSRPALK